MIDNNVLSLCQYESGFKYTKTIRNTRHPNTPGSFLKTPHNYPDHIVAYISDLMHYHCWENERLTYQPGLAFVDIRR